ncbi:MAG: hypothetical protein AAB131_07865, partial [Actinomycetota bacterium]
MSRRPWIVLAAAMLFATWADAVTDDAAGSSAPTGAVAGDAPSRPDPTSAVLSPVGAVAVSGGLLSGSAFPPGPTPLGTDLPAVPLADAPAAGAPIAGAPIAGAPTAGAPAAGEPLPLVVVGSGRAETINTAGDSSSAGETVTSTRPS